MSTTVAAAVIVAAVIVTAGVLPAGAVLPVPTIRTVTVDQLGPDSTITVVTHGDFDRVEGESLGRSLEVVTADGVRHPVYSVELRVSRRGWLPGDFMIADWRPELHTALLRVSLGADGDKLVALDVITGTVQEVAAPRHTAAAALDPSGSGVLITTYPRELRSGRVAALSWTGVKTWLPAQSEGPAITSVDGRTLVTAEGSARTWWVTDLAARTSTPILTPGECVPTRWYDATSVVATCFDRGTQLRRIGLDGISSPLGIRHRTRRRDFAGPVYYDGDLRVAQGRAWYESDGGCGGTVLSKQTAGGVARVVRVPGLTDGLSLVGVRGKDLLIANLERDECVSRRARGVLVLFDPVTRSETVLTRLARDEQWSEVVSATEVRAWIR